MALPPVGAPVASQPLAIPPPDGVQLMEISPPQEEEEALRAAELELYDKKYDLICQRVYYSGDFCRDYCTHLKNDHPLFSCLLADPDHPYTRSERTLTLVVVTVLSVLPVALINLACETENPSFRWFNRGLEPEVCFFWLRVWAFFSISIPVMIIHFVIEYAVVYSYKFEYKRDTTSWFIFNKCCGCMHTICQQLKVFVMGFCLTVATVLFVIAIVINFNTTAFLTSDAMRLLAIVRIQSWLTWFVFDFAMCCCGYPCRWRSERTYYENLAKQERKEEAKRKKEEEAKMAASAPPPPSVSPDLQTMQALGGAGAPVGEPAAAPRSVSDGQRCVIS